jgi:hypothetical protein
MLCAFEDFLVDVITEPDYLLGVTPSSVPEGLFLLLLRVWQDSFLVV